MRKVLIKGYKRRNAKGKIVSVKEYSRRVGAKGVHVPPIEKPKAKPGDELLNLKEKKVPNEAIDLSKVQFDYYDAQTEKELLEEQYRRKLNPERYRRERKRKKLSEDSKKDKSPSKDTKSTKKTRKSRGVLNRLEDNIADFVEKYSGKKYKKQL